MRPTEFETAVERLLRPDELWRLLVGFARNRGVMRLGYHHLPPLGAPDANLLRIENDGFAETLLAQYLTARINGIAALATAIQNGVRPIYLDEIETMPHLSNREKAHLAGYRAAGVANGLGLQVFGPNGRNGIFAVALPAEIKRMDSTALGELRWACQAMHLRYCALLVPTLGKPPQLSSREAEVLTWVARGKSNASIGGILGISAHTVDAHLRRIYSKLGVFDRISAALRALGFGLITLDT